MYVITKTELLIGFIYIFYLDEPISDCNLAFAQVEFQFSPE